MKYIWPIALVRLLAGCGIQKASTGQADPDIKVAGDKITYNEASKRI